MAKLTVGSLFAGIGGMELGLEMTGGFKTVWQVENDRYATRVLEKHWPDVRRWRDVATFPPDADSERSNTSQKRQIQAISWYRPGNSSSSFDWRVDLICGGFPCQPVSTAGKQRGEHDERWLWDEMRRVCSVLRPTWVLAENVPGLLSAKDVHGKRGALFGRVVQDLASLGYRVRWDCVPAASVGAPHIRDRVFIIAHADGCGDATGEQGHKTLRQFVRSSEDGHVAHAQGQRTPAAQQPGRPRGPKQGRADVPDADGARELQPEGCEQEKWRRTSDSSWWAVEPDVGRVANGVPKRVDRLRCLGNAVVPRVAQFIGQRILAAMKK